MKKAPSSDWHTTPRVYSEAALLPGDPVKLSTEQSHYLTNVMRLKNTDKLRFFNSAGGEWLAEISEASKKSCTIKLLEQLRPLAPKPSPENELWLFCAPIKKAHFEYMIEKATELGVTRIIPLLTQRTQIREVNQERCRSIAIEAAEQSERLTIPEIGVPVTLTKLNESYGNRIYAIVCAEWGEATAAAPAFTTIQDLNGVSPSIITGPEGGFNEEEMDSLHKLPQNTFIRLGPRILRADTAAIAALTCWQALRGDWQQPK